MTRWLLTPIKYLITPKAPSPDEDYGPEKPLRRHALPEDWDQLRNLRDRWPAQMSRSQAGRPVDCRETVGDC